MKKSYSFLLLLLLSTGLYAQKKTLPAAEKNAPTFEPAPNPDITAPVVTCFNGISVNVMPTGIIQLWASDFLHSVTDNVTPSDQIEIGLRKCGTGVGFPLDGKGNDIVSVVFECAEIGAQCVELWARDAAGNQNYCETYVMVEDNFKNCPGGGPWNIRLCVDETACDSTSGVEELSYQITTQMPFEPPFMLFELGSDYYCFEETFPIGINVSIAPMKDDNPLNGVTTYDLVILYNHMHGIETFTEPWQWIAADANRDGQITLEDSAHIMDLILGIYTECPNNTSWRFVLDGYTFPSPDPLSQPIPEAFTVVNLQDTTYDVHFKGIKIGDLNCTAVANYKELPSYERSEVLESNSIGLPSPNPTGDAAVLPLYLSGAENVYLEISDISGKLLWVNNLHLEKGRYSLEIPVLAKVQAGVYIWRVRAGEVVKAGKIVRY